MTVEPNIDIPELARLVRPPAIGIYIGYFSNSNTDRRVLRRKNRCSLQEAAILTMQQDLNALT